PPGDRARRGVLRAAVRRGRAADPLPVRDPGVHRARRGRQRDLPGAAAARWQADGGAMSATTTTSGTPVAAGTAVPTATAFAAARRRERRMLAVLALLALAAVAAFAFIGIKGNWEFALAIRFRKIATMAVVGVAIAWSSVLFQTVTGNRILTPSIMGFDQLFVLIQTVLVFLFGALALASADPRLLFSGQVVAMVGFAVLLYRWLFGRRGRDLYVMVLAGVIFGTLFGSLSSLAARLINPNDFVVLQDSLFASVNQVDPGLLG